MSQDIDFVNLRKEEYAEDSRVPTMTFGTAEEDASRRDLTINALFYNINTGLVEDFTGRGIQDLQAKLIRTPIDPVQTFKDDPLRMLRALRFAARFNFTCDPEMFESMQNQEIRDAFKAKISKERIGDEIQSALKLRNQKYYLDLLHSSGLLPVIFESPKSVSNIYSDAKLQQIFEKNAEVWRRACHLMHTSEELTKKMQERETRFLYFTLSSLLHDFVCCKPLKEDKKMNLLEYLLWHNLKLGKNISSEINAICSGIYFLQELVSSSAGNGMEEDAEGQINIEDLGMWVRESA